MPRPVDEDSRALSQKDKRNLSPAVSKAGKRLPRLAAVCEKASGGDANSVGMFYLNAAWAARRALCSPTLEVDISTRMLMPDLARKLAKQKADGAFDGYYIAFLLCRRAGLADRAKALLR
ncbi:MAG: hypothetical protein U5N86_11725 [Planctomycetota bacterium]|nr:hypothetical protein [Planctomycetota bacterium]